MASTSATDVPHSPLKNGILRRYQFEISDRNKLHEKAGFTILVVGSTAHLHREPMSGLRALADRQFRRDQRPRRFVLVYCVCIGCAALLVALLSRRSGIAEYLAVVCGQP